MAALKAYYGYSFPDIGAAQAPPPCVASSGNDRSASFWAFLTPGGDSFNEPFIFEKGNMMTTQSNSNRGGTHQQHVQAGEQSHKNSGQQQQASPRSGSHDQQMHAGQQSHKNASGSNSGNSASGTGTRGGSSEQHAAAGRQSHKNT